MNADTQPFIDQFVADLAAESNRHDRFNPYFAGHSPIEQASARLCQHNLSHYLAQMTEKGPAALMIGEALGYRGGRLTGIPFTSEEIITRHRAYFPTTGFQIGKGEKPRNEQTATIVWSTLISLIEGEGKPLPLLWNAYPYHPHQTDRPTSNRAPKRAELVLGGRFLSRLIDHFQPDQLIAVGRRAEAALNHLQLPHVAIRHPARGGKSEFVQGVMAHL